jgi:hypothetical protein
MWPVMRSQRPLHRNIGQTVPGTPGTVQLDIVCFLEFPAGWPFAFEKTAALAAAAAAILPSIARKSRYALGFEDRLTCINGAVGTVDT